MTDRAAYFVVARRMGQPTPMIFWDELPKAPIRGLEYVVRLDELPNGGALVRASLAQLFAVYQLLKKRGKLPPRWEPKPQKNERRRFQNRGRLTTSRSTTTTGNRPPPEYR